jgi:DNA-directed RNA polymerase specialized sigma24 family protein
MPSENILALDEALAKLAATDPVTAKLVHLRFFTGLGNEDAARMLGLSAPTASRYWRYARAWLHAEVSKPDDIPPSR